MRQHIIFALVIALAATGCQKKASGQTVAVVNQEEITAAELNDALASDPSVAGAATKEAREATLQKLIDRKLLVQQARKDGLDKSPAFINQQRRANDELLINMLLSKRLNTSELPAAAEIASYQASRPEMFANREIWTLQQILYPLPKDATLTSALGKAQSLDEITQLLTSKGIKYTRGTRKIDTAVFPHAIYSQLTPLKPGEPFIAPGPDKAVASVITTREPAPLTGDEARTAAVNSMRRDQVETIVKDRVKSLRGSAKIEYQPGFQPAKK
jgi:EpsD family peptidyl-prolyl cis-trans isomerase